jgi:DNA-binding transcriptional ArsR family regulator
MTPRHTPNRLTLDAILPHLRTKRISKRNGERHVLAHCPAHDDQNASLSLTEKADGTLLWKCFAGCSQEAVRRELERLAGMERETAHPIPPSRRGETRETAEPLRTFGIAELADAKRLDAEKLRAWGLTDLPDGGIEIPYRDTNGNTVAIRYRLALDGANRFRWRQGDTPCLYGLWRLDDWELGSDLYLCEGETDALTLWHAGLPALGIPGATAWKPEWWRNLWEFGRIVIIPDADKAGEQMTERLVATCPDHLRERVQVLQLPNGIKDANELWQREGANAERFKEALAGCAVEPVYHFITLNTPDKVINWQAEPIDLAEATPRPVEWLVKDLIPARHATNLYGDSGTGKSLIALYLALCVIEGIPFLNFPTTKRGKVLYLDLELDAEIHTLRWWAIARGAGYTTPPKGLRYVRWTQGLIGREGELWELIEQEQPALLIVDSFGKATGKPLDPDYAIALYNLFDALPVPVLVIDHTAKPNPEIPAESAREYGTVYKRHYARSAVQVDLQGSERGHIGVILRHQKSNFGRLAPEIPLTLAFLEEDGVLLEVRLQYGGQAVQANAELFGRRGEVMRFLTERQEATPKEIVEGTEIPQGSVYRLLAQLERDGVIEAVPDAYPKRYRLRGNFISLSPPIKADKVINCAGDESSNTAEPLPDLPAVFQNRTPYTWDLIDDWLQLASNPEDPFHLEPAELEAVRVMLAYAEARSFPSLVVDGYTIRGDMAGWLTAAQQLAGTPAIARATRMLHTLDASGTPHAPTHNTLLRNGDASRTPSQLSLEEV